MKNSTSPNNKLFKQLHKNTVLYGVTSVIGKFPGIMVLFVYTSYLSVAEIGILDLALTIASLCFILAEGELISGVLRSFYEAETKGDSDKLLGSAIAYYLVVNLVLILPLIILLLMHNDLSITIPNAILLPTFAVILPRQLFQLMLLVLRLREQVKLYCVFFIAELCLSIILGVVALLLDNGIEGILWGITCSQMLFALLSLKAAYSFVTPPLSFTLSFKYIKNLLHYGWPLVPVVLAGWGQVYLSRFFILNYLSLKELGLFAMASRGATLFLLFSQAFRLAMQPYYMSLMNTENSESRIVTSLNYYLFFAASSYVLLVPLMFGAYQLFVPVEYRDSIYLLPFMGAAFFWDGIICIFALGNNWVKKTYYNFYGTFLGLLVLTLMLVLLLKAYGIYIVPLITMVASLVRAIFIYLTSQSLYYIPYNITKILYAFLFTVIYPLSITILMFITKLNLFILLPCSLLVGTLFIVFFWICILSLEQREIMTGMLQKSSLKMS